MKVLQIIEAAYRGTLEEQDDTIVWITHAMKGAGADLNVLLRGNAVNYAVKGQRVDGLKFGDREQKHGPDIAGDVAGLIGKGIEVYIVVQNRCGRHDVELVPRQRVPAGPHRSPRRRFDRR